MRRQPFNRVPIKLLNKLLLQQKETYGKPKISFCAIIWHNKKSFKVKLWRSVVSVKLVTLLVDLLT